MVTIEIRTCVGKSCLIYLRYYQWYSLVQTPLKRFLYEYVLLVHNKLTWWVDVYCKWFSDKKFINFKVSGNQCIAQFLSLFYSKWTRTSMIDRCLSPVLLSAVVTLLSVPSRKPPVPLGLQLQVHPCLWISSSKDPPCPQNSKKRPMV